VWQKEASVSNGRFFVYIGILTFLILVGIFANIVTTSRLRANIRGEPVSLRSEIALLMSTFFGALRSETRSLGTELHRRFKT
jgi:hypothetical protein